MKRSKLFSRIFLILISLSIAVGIYMRVNVRDGVVAYLELKFQQKNIPVTKITILQETPLSLQILVQGSTQGVTTDDMIMLKSIDREVFISARQQGYLVDSYIT